MKLTPRFDPRTFAYTANIEYPEDAPATLTLGAVKRSNSQTVTFAIDSTATTANSGASVSTSGGVTSLALGTGGEDVYGEAGEGAEPPYIGCRAVIVLKATVAITNVGSVDYTVTITRLATPSEPEIDDD